MSSEQQGLLVSLSDPEARGIFRLLKEHEGALEDPLPALLNRLERVLFERLTIEEFEKLTQHDKMRS